MENSTAQQLQHPQKVADLEFSGSLGRALSSHAGAKFGLLLSMLQQDLLQRIQFAPQEEQKIEDSRDLFLQSLDKAPVIPLATQAEHYQQAQVVAESAAMGDMSNARLYQAMHPAPLSLYNDVKRLSDDVVENCDYYTRLRLAEETKPQIDVDETGLYEIIGQLNPEGVAA